VPVAAFAAWRTLAFVVFRCGELTKRMKLLLQPIQHAMLTDKQSSILEVQPLTLQAAASDHQSPITLDQPLRLTWPRL
jgi:hypothetical protein